MVNGRDIINKALPHVGERYVFGIVAPKDDPNYRGAWDCAEFTSWVIYQLTGKLYGCSNNNAKPKTADAWTGFYKRDAEEIGGIISVEEAINTPGAILLRYSDNVTVGHVVISDGKGGTVEAHSTKTGVIRGKSAGRRWDIGILIPWIAYEQNTIKPAELSPMPVVYRFTTPLMKGDNVKKIQRALKIKDDGIYGAETAATVRNFQLCNGLAPDGEVGALTAKALKINLL